MQIAEIFKTYESLIGKEVSTKGWVKTCRDQKKMTFIHLSDGTTQQTLQIVAPFEYAKNMEKLSTITTGTSLYVKGTLVKSPAAGQLFEISATEITICQICPTTFPLQKTGLPLEFLRTMPHLRHRSNIMRAVFKVKSVVTMAIHDFLTAHNYIYVDIPVLTTNACEGGCQPLQVTAVTTEGKISKIPAKTVQHEIGTESASYKTDDIDFTKDFFKNPVYLTVSNQLHLECFAHGLGYVYTMTPATRGEPSQSTKHLAHFSMLEYEGIFDRLEDNIALVEDLIKYCVKQAITKCTAEMEVLNTACDGHLITKLEKIMNEPFMRIEHRDAIKLMKGEHAMYPFNDAPEFAGDLSGEHERWLVKHFGRPVIVMRYPKKVKAFYMPVHHTVTESNETIEYVDCYDLLTDIGETVGGSHRITDEKELVTRMQEQGMDPKHLDWYVDLRRYGTTGHSGCGLGLERLIATITGMTNVKDCISFPITVGHCIY